MRSISLKIILVLVVVSLVGALFTAFYIQYRTRTAFDTFVNNLDKFAMADLLTTHYLENSSWSDADLLFKDYLRIRVSPQQTGGQQGRNPNRPGEIQTSVPFVLTDPKGIVLSLNSNHPGFQMGDQISDKNLKNSMELEIDGVVRGLLVQVPASPNRNMLQISFLQTVQQGLIISSVVTLLIALILGGILITSFTRPIRKLADGTDKIANGELGYQVEVHSADELGKLAASFNNMSRDLQKADRQRKQMTADIAHDLRTPLSILHGYTEAISEGKMSGNPEIYQSMHGQTRHLNYLIEELRTLSLLDSEELNFQLNEIDPSRIINEAGTSFSSLAAKNGITLILDLADDLPKLILDPDRLTQILGNLINNALNILPRGGTIWLKSWQEGDQLAIEIKDDGPGIPEEDLPLIFNRHYKVDRSRSQENGSSGLGLAITKKLVEAQRGEITVSSERGHGTVFQITFPLIYI